MTELGCKTVRLDVILTNRHATMPVTNNLMKKFRDVDVKIGIEYRDLLNASLDKSCLEKLRLNSEPSRYCCVVTPESWFMPTFDDAELVLVTSRNWHVHTCCA